MLIQRVLSAVVLVPLVIAVIFAGGPWFVGTVTAATLVALWEFHKLLRRAGYSPLWPFGVALSVAFLLNSVPLTGLSLVPGAGSLSGRLVPPAMAATLILSLLYLVLRQRLESSLVDWSLTWVPPLYVAFLASYLIALRMLPDGDRWCYLVAGVTWGTDVAAYFAGRAVGKRRFFPRISPKKTQEGALGGLIAGTIVGISLAWLFGWDPLRFVLLGLVAAVAAEAGDLAESLLKRQLQAKDASQLIPGHGGMLDRMDSLLFVGVVVYWWATWLGAGL